MEDVSDINYKQKYKKKNKKKLINPYTQIKQTVQRISGKKHSPSKNHNQEPLNGHKTQIIKPAWETNQGSIDE